MSFNSQAALKENRKTVTYKTVGNFFYTHTHLSNNLDLQLFSGIVPRLGRKQLNVLSSYAVLLFRNKSTISTLYLSWRKKKDTHPVSLLFISEEKAWLMSQDSWLKTFQSFGPLTSGLHSFHNQSFSTSVLS